MRGTRNGIFRNALGRRKISGHEVAGIARCGDDDPRQSQVRDCLHIRSDRADGCFVAENTYIAIRALVYFVDGRSQCNLELGSRRGRRHSLSRRKVQNIIAFAYMNVEQPAGRRELHDRPGSCEAQHLMDHRDSSQGCMAAKRNFLCRRKPAQRDRILVWSYECGFGKIVFRRNGLKGLAREPGSGNGNDRSRISSEDDRREGVDLPNRESDFVTHRLPLVLMHLGLRGTGPTPIRGAPPRNAVRSGCRR